MRSEAQDTHPGSPWRITG